MIASSPLERTRAVVGPSVHVHTKERPRRAAGLRDGRRCGQVKRERERAGTRHPATTNVDHRQPTSLQVNGRFCATTRWPAFSQRRDIS